MSSQLSYQIFNMMVCPFGKPLAISVRRTNFE